MQRADFEKHSVWVHLDRLNKAIDELRDGTSESEHWQVESLAFIASYMRTFKMMGATHSPLFTSSMMDQVANPLNQAASYLEARLQQGSSGQTSTALVHAESALAAMAPWPRPYASKIQATQMKTLFEDLLVRQDLGINQMKEQVASFRSEINAYTDDVKALRHDISRAETDLYAEAEAVTKLITDQKVRIDEVVQDGLRRVDSLTAANNSAIKKSVAQNQSAWESHVADSMQQMHEALTSADDSLAELRSKETEYANLTSAVAATKMAAHFATEAQDGRKQSNIFFIIGAALIALAAVPLIVQAIWPANGDPWSTFAIRLSIGALMATGATVAVRLGSRMLAEANASKRMELELRTFGPFLSNVDEKADVDNARLELVDRAFGKGYAPTNHHDSKEEVVTISAMSEIISALSKIAAR